MDAISIRTDTHPNGPISKSMFSNFNANTEMKYKVSKTEAILLLKNLTNAPKIIIKPPVFKASSFGNSGGSK